MPGCGDDDGEGIPAVGAVGEDAEEGYLVRHDGEVNDEV